MFSFAVFALDSPLPLFLQPHEHFAVFCDSLHAMAGGPVENDGKRNVRASLVQHRIFGHVLRHPSRIVRLEFKYEIHF